jgi:hypothetical protein
MVVVDGVNCETWALGEDPDGRDEFPGVEDRSDFV